MKKVLMLICMLTTGSLCWAQAPSLGTAANFAVLGGTAIACTSSVVTGDVGVSPGSVVTNTSCAISGTVHQNDSAASNARTDFLSAYNAIGLLSCTPDHTISTAAFTGNVPAVLGPFPLGNIPPGVYCFPAAVTFTDTTLTLDGSTNPNGIWIFKVGAALTGSGFQVVMANGAQPCNVFWAVGAAATLSTSTLTPLFQGNILAGDTTVGSISISGAAVVGRALASVAVTLTTGTNVNGVCTLVDQAKASCKNDDDDRDEDKDHHDRDDDHDRDHHRHHDKDKDHQDNDHRDHD